MTLKELKAEYETLGEGEKLLFLKWLHDVDPFKWDYATMCEPLRRFHNPKLER